MLSIKYSLQKYDNVRTKSCQGKVPFAAFVEPKIGKAMEIGFDHYEPFEAIKVQFMNRYCKIQEVMSKILGDKSVIELFKVVPSA